MLMNIVTVLCCALFALIAVGVFAHLVSAVIEFNEQ